MKKIDTFLVTFKFLTKHVKLKQLFILISVHDHEVGDGTSHV